MARTRGGPAVGCAFVATLLSITTSAGMDGGAGALWLATADVRAAAQAPHPCPRGFPGACRGFLRSRHMRLRAVLGQAALASPIREVAVTGDGRRAYGLRRDGALDIWDLSAGEARTLPPRRFVALSADGRWAVASRPNPGARERDFADGGAGVVLWDLTADRAVAHFDFDWEHAAFAVSPRVVVGGSIDGGPAVVVWNTKTGRLEHTLGADIPCRTFSVSSDGKRALCAEGGEVGLWDLEHRQLVRRVAMEKGIADGARLVAAALRFSADGRHALILGQGRQHTSASLMLWDLDSGASRSGPHVPRGRFAQLALSPDDQRLALLDDQGQTLVLELADAGDQPGRAARLAIEGARITAAAFTPKGELVTGDSTGVMRLWDPQRALELRASRVQGGHSAAVSALSASRDGARLFSVADDGTARTWDLRTGQGLRQFRLAQRSSSSTGLMTPDAARAVTGASGLAVLDLATGLIVRKLQEGPAPVRVKALSADGTRVIADDALWLTGDGSRVWRSADLGFAAAFSPDERLIYALRSNQVHVLDGGNGTRQATLGPRTPSGENAGALAISPAGDFLLVTLKNERLDVPGSHDVVARFDLPSGKRSWRVPVRKLVRSIAIGPDGERFTCAGGSHLVRTGNQISAVGPETIDLFDTATGRTVDSVDLSSSGASPHAVAFSPDGRALLVGTSAGSILELELRR